jgi:hypothetical protein
MKVLRKTILYTHNKIQSSLTLCYHTKLDFSACFFKPCESLISDYLMYNNLSLNIFRLPMLYVLIIVSCSCYVSTMLCSTGYTTNAFSLRRTKFFKWILLYYWFVQMIVLFSKMQLVCNSILFTYPLCIVIDELH